jgi:hypothetical protein
MLAAYKKSFNIQDFTFCPQSVISVFYVEPRKRAIIDFYNISFYNVDGVCLLCGKGKGKAIPLQAWTGPEVSRRLRLPDFMIIGARKW